MSRFLVLMTVAMLALSSPVVLADTVSSQSVVTVLAKQNPFKNKLYDASYKKWTSVYTPDIPWYWHKAQGIAESGLNPNAVSPVGAKGIGQFMPGTWNDMQKTLGFTGSPFTPSLNIQAQVFYMGSLMKQFKAERPLYDRWSLSLAAYNAGIGNIVKAQKLCNTGLLYAPMAKCLPKVTGKHSKETTDYVKRNWSYIGTLEVLEGDSND